MSIYYHHPLGVALVIWLVACTVAALDDPYAPNTELEATPAVSASQQSRGDADKAVLGGISIEFRSKKKPDAVHSHLPVPLKLIVNAAPTAAPSLTATELKKQKTAKRAARAKAQTEKHLASLLNNLPHGAGVAEAGIVAADELLLQLDEHDEVTQPAAASPWTDDDGDDLKDDPLARVLSKSRQIKKGKYHFVGNEQTEAAEKKKRDADHQKQKAKADFLLGSTSMSYSDDEEDSATQSYGERKAIEEREAMEEGLKKKHEKEEKNKIKSSAKPLDSTHERQKAAMKNAVRSLRHPVKSAITRQQAKVRAKRAKEASQVFSQYEKQAEIEEKFDANQKSQKARQKAKKAAKVKEEAKAKAKEVIKEQSVNFLTTTVFSATTEASAQDKQVMEDESSKAFAEEWLHPSPPPPSRRIRMDSDVFMNTLDMIKDNPNKEIKLGELERHIQKTKEDRMQATAAKLLAKTRQPEPTPMEPADLSLTPPKVASNPHALAAKLQKAGMLKQASNLLNAIQKKDAVLATQSHMQHDQVSRRPASPMVFDAPPAMKLQDKEAEANNKVSTPSKRVPTPSQDKVIPFEVEPKPRKQHKALSFVIEEPKEKPKPNKAEPDMSFVIEEPKEKPKPVKAEPDMSVVIEEPKENVEAPAKPASAPADAKVPDKIEIVGDPDSKVEVDGIEVPAADIVVDVDFP